MFVPERGRYVFLGEAITAPIGSDAPLTNDSLTILSFYNQETWELEKMQERLIGSSNNLGKAIIASCSGATLTICPCEYKRMMFQESRLAHDSG